MKATILTLTLMTVALSTPVSAEWGLYLNADNKRWNMIKTFAFEKDCDSAARSAVRSKQALGAGCSEYAALPCTMTIFVCGKKRTPPSARRLARTTQTPSVRCTRGGRGR